MRNLEKWHCNRPVVKILIFVAIGTEVPAGVQPGNRLKEAPVGLFTFGSHRSCLSFPSSICRGSGSF